MSVKVAAGFVIFRKFKHTIQYLLLQTSYGEHHWTPPKGISIFFCYIYINLLINMLPSGHVDPGETDEMVTALRETEEESGLKKSDLQIYNDSKHVLNYKVRGKPKTVIYWLAELINNSAQVKLSEEHQDFKWLELEEAYVYGNYDDMKEMLKHFDNYIKTKL